MAMLYCFPEEIYQTKSEISQAVFFKRISSTFSMQETIPANFILTSKYIRETSWKGVNTDRKAFKFFILYLFSGMCFGNELGRPHYQGKIYQEQNKKKLLPPKTPIK